MAETPTGRAGENLHGRVLDAIGRDIVSGQLPPGVVVKAEELRARYDVSLSVVREAVRVLESLGMVRPVRRLGLIILAMSEWTILDPLVVRWRMAETPARQLRSLTELRVAIEPEAAGLAATFADAAEAEEIMRLAARMRSSGRTGEVEAFLEADAAFHRAVLRAGGNELFASFDTVVAEILAGRTEEGLQPQYPHPDALQWHFDVADAIGSQQPERAREAMAKIVAKAYDEMSSVWEGEPRRP
ncbi:transcriptional regulator [Mycobacteroides abscessus subsp. abscessus]|uniref:GntR family transcriptional regulator n=3 Tax=Brevibacterium casei TaxID=33889 RepID=K9AMM6_9MICO|nr:FCD domain-containing protein [Brevibacterium casei]SIH93934.1 transcriptional regulator [Mycobacteroides abscessus subsp. abscessus]EKU48653.1 GntR family transcriptional regulator [Brevibacterium casei S18]MBE4693316.1 FadR family transcriptional regulator [Brevibacterium casei]MBY3576439.1 FadR family transcriptional regulator [Brevibacterium casei]MDH5150034.1 FCD domain-containing protein [Brevibacterium casei]